MQLKKPSNWQDFEKLCQLLWGEIWECSDSIKRHGRQGQNQHGVDVYAYVDKYKGYCGVQCKGKDEYTNAQLTKDEIDKEINKAKTFEPSLSLLVFATTANKDAKIEEYIRIRDLDNRKQGLFKIDISSWEDIVDHLQRYRETYNWYVNNCQFNDATDVNVTFNGEEKIAISPEFIRNTTHYILKQSVGPITDSQMLLRKLAVLYPSPITSIYPVRKIDRRWCKLHIRIDNIGSTVIKTPKLIVSFNSNDIEKLYDEFYYSNEFGLNNAVKAQINASKDAKREVFKTYSNVIEYKPKESVFVQKDNRNFTISIIPSDGISKMPLYWKLLCQDYQEEGTLWINIVPKYEDKEITIQVNSASELKSDEVTIIPKIVEE
ncbi:PDDEXK family nuclease [Prevotella herbatica]|nr:hypothetical protein [Prevotella herbatica]